MNPGVDRDNLPEGKECIGLDYQPEPIKCINSDNQLEADTRNADGTWKNCEGGRFSWCGDDLLPGVDRAEVNKNFPQPECK